MTLFAWRATKFVSSKRCTMYASEASCNAWMAVLCHLNSWIVYNWVISRTSREKGDLRSNSSVDCWYRRISFSAFIYRDFPRFLWTRGRSPAISVSMMLAYNDCTSSSQGWKDKPGAGPVMSPPEIWLPRSLERTVVFPPLFMAAFVKGTSEVQMVEWLCYVSWHNDRRLGEVPITIP